MTKFVITTIQPLVRKYYLEIDKPEWAHDSIVMQDVAEFSQWFGTEDILTTTEVADWPKAERGETVNAATMKYLDDGDVWEMNIRWDLDK